jgi:hypothetical protein
MDGKSMGWASMSLRGAQRRTAKNAISGIENPCVGGSIPSPATIQVAQIAEMDSKQFQAVPEKPANPRAFCFPGFGERPTGSKGFQWNPAPGGGNLGGNSRANRAVTPKRPHAAHRRVHPQDPA